ncbi:hypothetical protein AAG906_013962 [Vitis piasezkii]
MIAGLVLVLISSLPGLLQASPPPRYLVKPTCTNFTCGNFTIPYPFGMGEACYANSWYSINCNHSKPFLNHTGLNLEVLNISLDYQTVTVNSPISSLCKDTEEAMTETKASIDLNQSPFLFSRLDNIFMVLGCGSARLMDKSNEAMALASCEAICESGSTTIPHANNYFRNNYSVNLTTESKETGCVTHALMSRCYKMGYAPLALAWTIEENDGYASSRCNRSLHYELDRGTYSRDPCTCGSKTEGNPHLKNGCQGTLLS